MRILLITETVPYPLDSGGRIKTFHTLRMLHDAHEVHCHALTRASAPVPAALERTCTSVTLHRVEGGLAHTAASGVRALFRGWPLTVARHCDALAALAMRRAVEQIRPDLLYVDHLSMMAYPAVRQDVPTLHDAHNVEHRLFERYADTQSGVVKWLAGIEARRLRGFETTAYRAAAGVLAVSATDGAAIATLAGEPAKVHVVPIAVDVAGTPPPAPLTRRPRLLYIGGLHWPPNRDAVDTFTRDTLPLVRREVPGAELVVVGRTDTGLAREIGSRPGVRLAGALDSLDEVVASSRALVVPLRSGSGTRVKILDAFARGLPVVSTPMGHEGLDITSGSELLAGEGPVDFAAAVVRVLRDDALAERMRDAGREYVRQHHDLPAVRPRLLRAVDAVTKR